MITRTHLVEKILAYLNEEISLAALVDWAEDVVGLEDVGPDEDIDLLMDILMYLAAADSPAFPLGWDVSVEFLRRLGVSVRVQAA